MSAVRGHRFLRVGVLHFTLIFGSVVFAAPFVWLVGTSAKVSDELYPPRWLPEIPPVVETSPYMGIRSNERPVRPATVSRSDWDRLRGPILKAIGARAASLKDEVPSFYGPYLDSPILAEGLMFRILKRAPDNLFQKVEPVATSYFANAVQPALVEDVFDKVYRRAAFADVVFHGWDITTESPTIGNAIPWKVVDGDVTLVDRHQGLLRRAMEAHYSFKKTNHFTVQITLPIKMAPKNLKKIVVSVHGDRSWHPIHAVVEHMGRRYEAASDGYLSSDQWQDVTWQFASSEDNGVMMRNWLRLVDKGPAKFHEPGKVRITLTVRGSSRALATYYKWINNYKLVMRMAPIWLYTRNSILLVVLNIFGQILASSLVAFAFARLQWPGRDFFFILVLATLMIPPQVTMIPVFLIFKSLGWYDTLKPLWVTAFFGSAFYIFLLRQFMRGIPRDLEDSAKIDGCGYLRIYWNIVLPLVRPALATIGIFTFLATWNEFMMPLIYLNNQRLYPLSLGLFSLQAFQYNQIDQTTLMMAASVVMTLPIIILFFVAQRQFIQGIALTGLKG